MLERIKQMIGLGKSPVAIESPKAQPITFNPTTDERSLRNRTRARTLLQKFIDGKGHASYAEEIHRRTGLRITSADDARAALKLFGEE